MTDKPRIRIKAISVFVGAIADETDGRCSPSPCPAAAVEFPDLPEFLQRGPDGLAPYMREA